MPVPLPVARNTWADRVDAQILMELMRHEDIETTLRFYVGRNARRTSRALWRAYNREIEERSRQAGDGHHASGKEVPESPEIDDLGTSLGTSDLDSSSDCGSRNDESPCDTRA